jgi:hypothetical protein
MDLNLYLLLFNIIALIFSGFLFKKFNQREKSKSLFLFRFINILFIILNFSSLVFHTSGILFDKIAWSFGLLYLSIVFFEITNKIIIFKLGEERNGNYEETHSSRIMTLLSIIFVFFFTIIIFVKIWNFDSALETTGLIGIVLGFLAFSSSIWAPDLLSGLLLLNNSLLNNSDIIKFKNEKYIIFRFGFFETVLLNIDNNNRTIVKNSSLRDGIIDNYNKVAGTSGIREYIDFKIAYTPKQPYEEYFVKLETLRLNIEEIFMQKNDLINNKTPIELLIIETGDFAITIRFAYYIKSFNDIKTTNKAREIFALKSKFNKTILIESQKLDISLDTPILMKNNILNLN